MCVRGLTLRLQREALRLVGNFRNDALQRWYLVRTFPGENVGVFLRSHGPDQAPHADHPQSPASVATSGLRVHTNRLPCNRNGRAAGAESRRRKVLPAGGDRGAELLQVHLDHHPQQSLRCHQVPGGAPRRRGGAEGAGRRQRHRELRGRGTLQRRQRDGQQHGDRRAAPGRPSQDRYTCGNTGDRCERRNQLVVQPGDSCFVCRHRNTGVPHLQWQRVTSSPRPSPSVGVELCFSTGPTTSDL